MRAVLSALVLGRASGLVQVEQFGMAQCPMTSTLTTDFWNDCFVHGKGVAESVNYTLNMVGGTHGGAVDNSSWNKSFHGDQEVRMAQTFRSAIHFVKSQAAPSRRTDRGGQVPALRAAY